MARPVGLVLIAGGNAIGGAERRFLRIFQAFYDRHPDSHLFVSANLYNLAIRQGILAKNHPNIQLFVNFRGVPAHGWGRYFYSPLHITQLLFFVWRYKIKVLHLIMTAAFTGLPALMLFDVAGVVSVVNSKFAVFSSLGQPVYVQTLRLVKRLDVLAPGIARRILESPIAFPGLGEKISVAPCSFTDYKRFVPIEPKENIVAFVGRLEPIKSPLLMADVGLRVLQVDPEIEIHIVGFGSQEEQLKEKIGHFPEQVRAKIQVYSSSKVEDVLGRARILVSLQVEDNYPSQAVLEAMACGCAIVASDVGDTSLFVDESVGARVPLDADAIAATVLRLTADEQLCKKLGANARHRATQDHSLTRFIEYLEELYEMSAGG